MIRSSIVIALAAVTHFAHAGFVTGAIVGSSLSSSSTTQGGGDIVIQSDKHDVITCCRYHKSSVTCDMGSSMKNSKNEWIVELKPLEYARHNGYSSVHKIGIVSRSSKCDLIMMEVSR